MTRRDQTQEIIDRGDVSELLRLAEGYPCACKGAEDGEPHCVCLMTSRQIREAVSLAALRHGKLVRLTQEVQMDPQARFEKFLKWTGQRPTLGELADNFGLKLVLHEEIGQADFIGKVSEEDKAFIEQFRTIGTRFNFKESQMNDEMIERVARAIAQAWDSDFASTGLPPSPRQIKMARAAVKEIEASGYRIVKDEA